MTFYEALGVMFMRAAEALSGGDLDGPSSRQIREVTVFLRRMNALWPDVFSCLCQEITVLQAGLSEVNALFVDAGMATTASWLTVTAHDDPLSEYRRLVGAFDEAMTLLHEHRSEAWAADALGLLRTALAAALQIQGRLVDLALAA